MGTIFKMKSIFDLFTDTWKKKVERNWKYVYIMVDLHGVILPPSYHKKNDFQYLSPFTKPCLQYLSNKKDVILILWSSSHSEEIDCVREWLKKDNIEFRFYNQNPLEMNTDYADFSKKFYFSICLDDKSGFEPSDWKDISKWMSNNLIESSGAFQYWTEYLKS